MNRPPRRKISTGRIARAPLRARPLPGPGGADGPVATLRRTRMALQDIEGQLGRLLVALRDPALAAGKSDRTIDRQSPDRLRAATAEASAALVHLAGLRDQIF